MMNQFWLAEMMRQLSKEDAKPQEKEKPKTPTVSATRSFCRSVLLADLGEVKEDLKRLEINLDRFLVLGTGNVRDLFHHTARYSGIRFRGFCSRNYEYYYYILDVRGERESLFGSNKFDLCFYHLGEDKIHIPQLQRLEHYFHRRNAAHEKEFNSTYRTK